MRPSEVRERILIDHQRIRGLVAEVEALAERVRAGRVELCSKLRERGTALYEQLCRHLDLEDVVLAGALRKVDAWGEERAEELEIEHSEQRELLAYLLQRLDDSSQPATLLVEDLIQFTALLRDDMKREERDLLSEELLRDDVIGIDVNSG
jgi:hemerythrin-like domain-containing protein